MTSIESRQNGTLKHLARLARDKKYRISCGEILCEGSKMLGEALQAGMRLCIVLVRSECTQPTQLLAQRAGQAGAQLYCAQAELFAQASSVETPQEVIFTCMPPVFTRDILHHAKRVLLLDGIQDPGNMGTILRTADAFALDAVVLAEGCTDGYAPKVVRATMGAIFRLPVLQMPLEEAVATVRQAGLPIYAAALTKDAMTVCDVALSRSAVIIGSEGHGVSQQALQWCDKSIVLPMQGSAESLNAGVAAAILMWEMTKNCEKDEG